MLLEEWLKLVQEKKIEKKEEFFGLPPELRERILSYIDLPEPLSAFTSLYNFLIQYIYGEHLTEIKKLDEILLQNGIPYLPLALSAGLRLIPSSYFEKELGKWYVEILEQNIFGRYQYTNVLNSSNLKIESQGSEQYYKFFNNSDLKIEDPNPKQYYKDTNFRYFKRALAKLLNTQAWMNTSLPLTDRVEWEDILECIKNLKLKLETKLQSKNYYTTKYAKLTLKKQALLTNWQEQTCFGERFFRWVTGQPSEKLTIYDARIEKNKLNN